MLAITEQSGHTLLGPAAPRVLSLKQLIPWLLQPKRVQVMGEAPMDELELIDTDIDRRHFDDEVLASSYKVLSDIAAPVRLSELLASLQEDGCPELVQDAVVLNVLQSFDPEDEAGAITLNVSIVTEDGLATERCSGDDVLIEPVEDHA